MSIEDVRALLLITIEKMGEALLKGELLHFSGLCTVEVKPQRSGVRFYQTGELVTTRRLWAIPTKTFRKRLKKL